MNGKRAKKLRGEAAKAYRMAIQAGIAPMPESKEELELQLRRVYKEMKRLTNKP